MRYLQLCHRLLYTKWWGRGDGLGLGPVYYLPHNHRASHSRTWLRCPNFRWTLLLDFYVLFSQMALSSILDSGLFQHRWQYRQCSIRGLGMRGTDNGCSQYWVWYDLLSHGGPDIVRTVSAMELVFIIISSALYMLDCYCATQSFVV